MSVLMIGLGITLASCWGFGKKPIDDPVLAEAYVPVYGIDSTKFSIKTLQPQPVARAGKMYVWGNYLFQVDEFKGVHVINYSDRQNPVKLSFITIRGCTEVAVKGNVLVANNLQDLVSLDVRQPTDVKEVGRIKDAFPGFYSHEMNPPPDQSRPALCPDLSKGDVVGWSLEKNVKAGCYY
jgi:hypothetical protein